MLDKEGEIAGGILFVSVGVYPELPGDRLASNIDCELVLDARAALELVQALDEPSEIDRMSLNKLFLRLAWIF